MNYDLSFLKTEEQKQTWKAIFDALDPMSSFSLAEDGAAYSREIRDAVAKRFSEEGNPISCREISGSLCDMYCLGYLRLDDQLKLRRPLGLGETSR